MLAKYSGHHPCQRCIRNYQHRVHKRQHCVHKRQHHILKTASLRPQTERTRHLSSSCSSSLGHGRPHGGTCPRSAGPVFPPSAPRKRVSLCEASVCAARSVGWTRRAARSV
eukprot:1671055-Rhodomonas_salina.1